MINLFENFQYLFLRHFYRLDLAKATDTPRLPLAGIFGARFSTIVNGKTVVDFGCGHGGDVVQLSQLGAELAIGLDVRPELIADNQARLEGPGVQFTTHLSTELAAKVDLVISVDAFEHFDDPVFILKEMQRCLRPGGEVWISFGPPWHHPRGGHLFSVFPWAHLILSEKALIRWRAQYFHDGATRFNEVAGGLNKMTLAEFDALIATSGLKVLELHCRPIWGRPLVQKILGREFGTAMVMARLRKF